MTLNCLRAVLAGWLLLALLAGSARPAVAEDGSSVAIDPRVRTLLAQDGAADVLILLGPQPDLSPAYGLSDKVARGRWVAETLRAAAARSQRPLIAQLQRERVAYRAFWIVNAVAARLTTAQIARMATLPEVTAILPDTPYRAIPEPAEALPALAGPQAVEWGVNRVKAPWAWSQGITGQGVVVAGQDTGYDWDHPALINAYRGYDRGTATVSHDYNWHDAIHTGGSSCGADSPAPCDDNSHGTHTMGTMVGNDLAPDASGWPAAATNAIGVAPGARWIGCRNMNNGYGTPSTYIECFEWLIAPYPVGGTTAQGDPSQAPDIINNSWGCPPSEGCTGPEIEPILNAADAAGILVVVSAGNSGSSCNTVVDPPAIYPAAFSVGATDSADGLASFSSRGPVSYNGQTFLKPNISAPGVSVRSSVPSSTSARYSTMSGTSMAGPHVAGVAALLLAAEPALRGQTDLIKEILARTADPKTYDTCGPAPGAVPNNGYGWGIVNAQRAIQSLGQPGTLTGTVTDAETGAPLADVQVTLFAAGSATPLADTTTAGDGRWSFSQPWGKYRVEVSTPGYDPGTAEPLYVVGGQTTGYDFALVPIPAVTDLRVEWSVAGLQLGWTALSGNVTGYELWRGTAPYFVPGTEGIEIFPTACTQAGAIVTCTDAAAAIGDPTVNHFYVAYAIGAGGGRSLPSNRGGEFDFALTRP